MAGHTTQLQNLIDQATKGDDSAWDAALRHVCERLRSLASRMMRTNQRVRRWAETDDVLQNSLIRLHRSLSEVRPESPRQFYGLATTHMRRELIDLASRVRQVSKLLVQEKNRLAATLSKPSSV